MARSTKRTTAIGKVNSNEQRVLGPTGRRGSDHGQTVYVLACERCGHEYGANGSDVWLRKCPQCQSGKPGFEVSAADVIDVLVESPQEARNPSWSRDELILALDLYMTNPASPPGKTSKPVIELSGVLNALAQQLGSGVATTFRNPNGVYMKMMNFKGRDPEFTSLGKVGLTRGNKDEEVVWNEFAGDLDLLKTVSSAIRKAVADETAPFFVHDDDDHMMEAAEGRVLTRLHRTRERNRKLVETKKAKVLKTSGKLVCEVCEFDFATRYGPRGEGFIEAHHTKPVHTLPEGGTTKLEDLALVCSNCHRMIHSSRPWLSIAGLRSMLVSV
jgi:5-methylcytosine-specific restriction protein A